MTQHVQEIPLSQAQIEKLLSLVNAARSPDMSLEIMAARLAGHLEDWNKQHEFKPGMLVKWKTGMKFMQQPGADTVAIVVSLIQPPLRLETHSMMAGVELDIRIGWIDPNDDTFNMCPVESRLFEPYEL